MDHGAAHKRGGARRALLGVALTGCVLTLAAAWWAGRQVDPACTARAVQGVDVGGLHVAASACAVELGRTVVLDFTGVDGRFADGARIQLAHVRVPLDAVAFLQGEVRTGEVDLEEVDVHVPAGADLQGTLQRARDALRERRDYRIMGMEAAQVSSVRVFVGDEETPRILLDGRMQRWSPGQPVEGAVRVRLATDGGAVHAVGNWNPDPAGASVALRVTAEAFALEPLSRWMPPLMARPAAGAAACALEVSYEKRGGVTVRGAVHLAGAVLAQAGVRGEPLDASVDVDAAGDMEAGTLEVRAFNVRSPHGTVEARLSLPGWGWKAVRDAHVKMDVEDLGKIVRLLPGGAAGGVLADVTLEGPFSAVFYADAGRREARVDLDRAHVAAMPWFDKPTGVPMNVVVEGIRTATALEFPRMHAVLDDIVLQGTARVPLDGEGTVVAEFDSEPVAIKRLARVAPPVAEALSRRTGVSGEVRINVSAAAGEGGGQSVHAGVLASGLQVDATNLQLRGNAFLRADLVPGAPSTLNVAGVMTDLSIRARRPGGGVLLEKPRGLHAELSARVLDDGAVARVEKATVQLGSSRVVASGTLDHPANADAGFDVVLHPLELRAEDARLLSERAAGLPRGALLTARARATGKWRRLESLRVVSDTWNLRAGRSVVEGSGRLAELARPAVGLRIAVADVRGDDAARLASVLPPGDPWRAFLAGVPAGARLRARGAISGRTGEPANWALDVPAFVLESGQSRVAGSVMLEDATQPRVDLTADLSGVRSDDVHHFPGLARLEPGARVEGRVRVHWEEGHDERFEAHLERIRVRAPDTDVTITADIARLDLPRVDVRLEGDLLSPAGLQRVLGGGPLQRDVPRVLEPAVRERLRGSRAVLRAEVANMDFGRVVLSPVSSSVRLEGGVLVADRLLVGLAGGTVDLDGARVDLAGSRVSSRVDVHARGVDSARVAAALTGDRTAYAGNVDVDANLTAVGLHPDDIRASVSGPFSAESPELRVRDFRLHVRVFTPAPALQPLEPGVEGPDPRPYFRTASVSGRLENGVVTLTAPFRARTSYGDLELTGTVPLHAEMRLEGTTSMTPDTVKRMTLGAYAPSTAVVAPVVLSGTPDKVVLEQLDPRGFAEQASVGSLWSAADAVARASAEGAREEVKRLRAQAATAALREASRLQAEMRRERDEAFRRNQALWRRRDLPDAISSFLVESSEPEGAATSPEADGGVPSDGGRGADAGAR